MTGKGGKSGTGDVAAPAREEMSVDLARRILAMRRLRDRLLGEFFAEPAWDILLDLYVQSHGGKVVTVSQLSLSTGAPATTALRWINKMAQEGLLTRRSDELDGRRVIVTLSARGEEAMHLLLASVLSELETPLGTRTGLDGSRSAAQSLRSRCETSPSSSTRSSTHDPETAS
ncbi:MAG: winged helix DNA-binding protein [Alphaproteobacteria bacterium]|nr:winged helix DNA-binding protein [Alphaproteobacteria bacterium]